MKNILILEDDKKQVSKYLHFLEAFECPNKCTWARNINEAKEYVLYNNFDIFLIDLQLEDGSGLDFIESIKDEHQESWFVIITGSDISLEDELNSFRHQLCHYFIRKPVQEKDFVHVFEKLFQYHLEERETFLDIVKKNCIYRIDIKKILYIEIIQKNLVIYQRNDLGETDHKVKEINIGRTTLSAIKKQLPDYFIQIHKSIIINTKYYESAVYEDRSWYIKLAHLTQHLPVGIKFVSIFMKRLKNEEELEEYTE